MAKRKESLFPLPPQHDVVDPKAEARVSSLPLRIEGEIKKSGIDDTVAISLKISPSDLVESGSEVRSPSLLFSFLLYCFHLFGDIYL